MADLIECREAGYRYLPGILPYSAGVAALEGYEIERVRLPQGVALEDGFRRIEWHLKGLGRPRTALCACELRSPAPFSEAGFAEFNRGYLATLRDWGIVREGQNPVARSNVCPQVNPPDRPGIYAFSYTVARGKPGGPSFVIAGCGEAPEGRSSYRDHIVRRGDVSAEGLWEKARWVLAEQERRLRAFGAGWTEVTAGQLYTVHGVSGSLAEEMARRGAFAGGLTWHFARPPVVEIEFEMDCRGVFRELAL